MCLPQELRRQVMDLRGRLRGTEQRVVSEAGVQHDGELEGALPQASSSAPVPAAARGATEASSAAAGGHAGAAGQAGLAAAGPWVGAWGAGAAAAAATAASAAATTSQLLELQQQLLTNHVKLQLREQQARKYKEAVRTLKARLAEAEAQVAQKQLGSAAPQPMASSSAQQEQQQQGAVEELRLQLAKKWVLLRLA